MKKLLVVLILVVAGVWFYRSTSKKDEPQPPVPVSTTTPKAIPQSEATAGSSLNAAFPKSGGEYKVVFTQEKDGFSQAELHKGSAKVAALTVSDTAANPSARDKFKSSARKINGHPAAAVGSQGSAILVAGRYQVQVRSLQPSFTAADRDAWLEKFNLSVLNK